MQRPHCNVGHRQNDKVEQDLDVLYVRTQDGCNLNTVHVRKTFYSLCLVFFNSGKTGDFL